MGLCADKVSEEKAIARLSAERARQREKWGEWWEGDTLSPTMKLAILVEEMGEVAKELFESGWRETPHLRTELTHVGAVAIAWLETLEEV